MSAGRVFSGLLLALANLVLWGCWPFMAQRCNAGVAEMLILLLIGEAFSAIFLVACIHPEAYSNGDSPAAGIKYFVIVLGGFLIAFADFFLLCSFRHLPSAIALPITAGLMMCLGTFFNYLVTSSNHSFNENGKYPTAIATLILFSAVFISLGAIIMLAFADYQRHISKSLRETPADAVGTEELNPIQISSDVVTPQNNELFDEIGDISMIQMVPGKIEHHEEQDISESGNYPLLFIYLHGITT
jgi:hypothetical protein